MRRWAVRGAIGIGVVVAILVGGWAVFQVVSQPAEPSAFYDAPDPLPDGPPGTVIRHERVETPATGQRAWKVLYTSTDPQGDPIAVSGIVAVGEGAAPAGGRPVVGWAHGTSGVASRCAPSLAEDGNLGRVPELARLLDAGAILAATDYPGLGTAGPHPYLVGESEGRALLDGMRAARSLVEDETGEATVDRSVVYGHSQGGHAVLFADALAGDYAPDLGLVGAAAMAPPTDLGRLLELDQGEDDGIVLTALALASWDDYYGDVDLDDVVNRSAIPEVERVGRRCILTTEEGLADAVDIVELRQRFLSADPATAPGWGDHLRENAPGPVPAGTPLLVAQGLADTLVRPEITEQYVQGQCAAGASIALATYEGVGHFQVRTVAAGEVVGWLLDRLAGTPATSGCSEVPHPAS
jgi:hypothetical protein